MEVVVRYFAAAREAAGRSSERLSLEDGATLAHLKSELARRHPGLERLAPSLRYAVDERFAASGDEPLLPEAVVALLPPVSGG
jgi:molybdopterin synthase sulfur carrier subunit